MSTQTAKKTPIQQVLEVLHQTLIVICIFSFFINIFMLTLPIYMLQIFDRVLPSHTYETLFFLTLIAVFVLMIFSLLSAVRSFVMLKVHKWLGKQLSIPALKKSVDHYLQGQEYGVRAIRDIEQIRNFLILPNSMAFFDIMWIPVYLMVLFFLHTTFGIIALLGGLILLLLGILNELSTRKHITLAQQGKSKTFDYLLSLSRNAEVIQGMGMLHNLLSHWEKHNESATNLQQTAAKWSTCFLSIIKFFRMLLQMLIFGVGAYYVIRREITPGTMIAASIITSRALAPIEQTISIWSPLIKTRNSYYKLKNYFSAQNIRFTGMSLPPPKGTLSVEGLSFAYPQASRMALINISFIVPQGTMVGMIGPSGAGKSTLLSLLVGTQKPLRGKVRLDGADVYHRNREELGRFIGYIPQNLSLFPGTVKENIARMGEADPDAIIAAGKKAGAHELILHLPQGYDTPLNMDGIGLSSGQLQRIALARAFYGSPTLLFLDEPNSNLDSEGEGALLQALYAAKKEGITILVISHRGNILQLVDNILFLKEGNMIQYGPKDQILTKKKQNISRPAKPKEDS